MDYDSEKYFLGQLCKYNHDYDDSGKSLRYHKGGMCVQCISFKKHKYYLRNKEILLEKSRKYHYENHNETTKQQCLYRLKNKDKLSAQKREHHLKNKKILNKKSYEYYLKNREYINEKRKDYHKEYRELNKDKIREYYEKNKDEIKTKQKIWYQNNKDKKRKAGRLWHQKQIELKNSYYIANLLRGSVRKSMKKYSETGKIRKSGEYGIDYGAIINHLGPHPNTLGKKGVWHIDHILPLSAFDLNDPEQIKLAFAPENHQWLLAKQNLIKLNHIPNQTNIFLQQQYNYMNGTN